MKNIAHNAIGLLLLLGLAGPSASAQNQAPATTQISPSEPSLGSYARQVRKDPGGTSKPKVYDNDNLPTNDKLSVIGQTPAAPEAVNSTEAPGAQSTTAAPATANAGEAKPATEIKAPEGGATAVKAPDGAAAAAKAPDGAAAAPQNGPDKEAAEKQWEDKLAAQKDQIALLTRELDVEQREYQIRAAAMYADAGNRMRNSADWDKQDAQYKEQIAAKQKALDDAKQKLDDTQEDARKAGVSASARE